MQDERARRTAGYYDRSMAPGERWAAFVPHDLPPREPALDLPVEIVRRADAAMARLRDASPLLPSTDWVTFAIAQKESLLTSQIEGTQATMDDVLDWQARRGGATGGEPTDDVAEVLNHTAAMAYAFGQVTSERGLPICSRLLDNAHRILLRGVRGADRLPGEVRRSQNWVGGTRPGNAAYVPPPHTEVGRLLSSLYGYVHQDSPDIHPIVRAALVHAQFELIHPYLDGNGRLGRLLVVLLLHYWGVLDRPVLHLSVALKRRRREYYDRLADIPLRGDWEGWVSFFVDAVADGADQTVAEIHALARTVEADRHAVVGQQGVTVAAIRLFEMLPRFPVVEASTVARELNLSNPAALRAIGLLVRTGVLVEQTGRLRGRQWSYEAYVSTLAVGTELA